MLLPRRLDQEGLRAYLDEVRPRFLVVRVRVKRRTIAWGMPLSALEDLVGFALGAVAFGHALLPWLPARWRLAIDKASQRTGGSLRLATAGATAGTPGAADDATSVPTATTPAATPSPIAALLATANDLAGGALRDVLRIPPGEPYVSVRTDTAHIDLIPY